MSEHLSERLSEHPSEPGAGMDPAERPARMPRTGTERELLQGWLDTHRQTLRWKASNLGLDQLLQPSVAPSGLTLLGWSDTWPSASGGGSRWRLRDGRFRTSTLRLTATSSGRTGSTRRPTS